MEGIQGIVLLPEALLDVFPIRRAARETLRQRRNEVLAQNFVELVVLCVALAVVVADELGIFAELVEWTSATVVPVGDAGDPYGVVLSLN